MKTETVTVTYIGPTLVEVEPKIVFVDPEDTIEFRREGPMVGKMRVTFTEKEFFDTVTSGEFHEGDGHVRVKTLPHGTTYICELLGEKNRVIASSDDKGGGGGAVEPGKNAPKIG